MHATYTGGRVAALALAWLAGVAVHLQERSLAPVEAYAALLACGAAAVLAGWRWRRGLLLALLGAALAGTGASGLRAAARLSQALAPALEGVDLRITGLVASLPQHGPTGTRFRFEVEAATAAGAAVAVPRRISLGWYHGPHDDAAGDAPQRELRAGQRWRLSVRLRRPHGTLNPHGHDFELSLFEQGVRAIGSVRAAPAPVLLDAAAGHRIERLRQRIRDAILASVPDRRAAGVLAALVVGDQGAIEREDWELFRNTGVAHLVAISGLHITMIGWWARLAVGRLWRCSRRACLRLPAPAAARWGGLCCAAGYALLAGWGVPAQRTVWMLATVTLLQSSGSRWPWPLVLLVAAVVVSLGDPWALLQPGFWLSFMAVGLLMASAPSTPFATPSPSLTPAEVAGWRRAVQGVVGAARQGVRTQVIATLGLAPLTLIFFQQVSVVGLAANLLAIPLVTLLITPLALLGTVAAPLWSLAALGVQGLAEVLALLSGLPGSVWRVPAAPAWAQATGLLAAALLVLPLPWRVRALAAVLMLPLLLPGRPRPEPGHFDLLALDVGQGTAVLVRTHGHLLVYDAGPQYARDSDAGQRVLLPVLRAQGTTRIDRLVLSHRDTDHVGGARALLAALPVADVLSSLEAGHVLLAPGQATTRCVAGQRWEWDGVRFEVLRPWPDDYARQATLKPNALSCVLRVSGGGRSALLAGDIERAQEAELVATRGAALRSDVLLAPHHGSRTSSTPAFLDAVAPRLAVFQAAYRSRFGHPAPDVVARYRERSIGVVVSPACGAWRWAAQGPPDGLCHRAAARRYWHLQPESIAR